VTTAHQRVCPQASRFDHDVVRERPLEEVVGWNALPWSNVLRARRSPSVWAFAVLFDRVFASAARFVRFSTAQNPVEIPRKLWIP
jgi:hypothetical protein